MPTREPLCHCGFERSKAPAPERKDLRGERRGLLFGALLVSACGLLLYARAAQRERSLRDGSVLAGSGTRGGTGYAPLPTLAARDTPPAEPAPSAESVAPIPEGWSALTAGPAATPRPPETAAAPRPAASPQAIGTPGGTPAPTAMEEAWAQATTLLEPTLRKIAVETGALEARYRSFDEVCVASARGSSSGPAPVRNWLVALRAAAGAVGREQSGIPLTDKGATVDCQALWKGLLTRADELKAELDRTENLARTSGVLPGHWRTLLATHRLEGWAEY